jgi:ParB family chromosome partitioning protein
MTKDRRGLGQGLDALLRSTAVELSPAEGAAADGRQPAAAPGVREVPIDALRPNPYQPRQSMDSAALSELADSIRVHGLIQPLLVAPDGDGYCLIAGERRWQAARLAGLTQVPVVVRTADPQEMLALAIIENVQRADLGPIETADAYRRLVAEFGLTQTEVAHLVGKSRTAVANTLRLINLSADVRALVVDGQISEGHARALLAVEDPAQQLALAHRAIAAGWTVRQMEAEVRQIGRPRLPVAGIEPRGAEDPRPSAARDAAFGGEVDPDTAAAVDVLQQALGTRVEIRRRGEGGQLVLFFYSEEELSALYDRLTEGA